MPPTDSMGPAGFRAPGEKIFFLKAIDSREMLADGFGEHLLLQFIQDRLLVRLVDLDDFFNTPIDPFFEEIPNGVHGPPQ